MNLYTITRHRPRFYKTYAQAEECNWSDVNIIKRADPDRMHTLLDRANDRLYKLANTIRWRNSENLVLDKMLWSFWTGLHAYQYRDRAPFKATAETVTNAMTQFYNNRYAVRAMLDIEKHNSFHLAIQWNKGLHRWTVTYKDATLLMAGTKQAIAEMAVDAGFSYEVTLWMFYYGGAFKKHSAWQKFYATMMRTLALTRPDGIHNGEESTP